MKMILKCLFLIAVSHSFTTAVDVDYITIAKQWRQLKDLPKETHEVFTDSMNNLKTNLFKGFSDISEAHNITLECIEDTALLYLALNNSTQVPPGFPQTAAMVKDAMGVQPPGMIRGVTIIYGFKQECDLIHFEVPQRERPFETAYSRTYIDALVLEGYNKTCDRSKTMILGFDVCLPKSCNKDDILAVVQIAQLFPSEEDPVCSVTTFEDIKVDYDYRSYIVLSVFFLVIILAVLSMTVDYLIIPEKSPLRSHKGIQLFFAFSFHRNVSEIMTAGKSNQPGQIGPIHFIRVISITWVIVAHVFALFSNSINNFFDYEGIIYYPFTQVIMNGFYSVDNFFFIGAVLVSFLFFKELERNRKAVMSFKGWIMFYVHRYIRLSPSYFMAAAFVTWVVGPWLSERVYHFAQEKVEDPCNKYFWRNVLYINNLWNLEEECFGQSWYLAADMQMFVLSPVILVSLAMKPILGVIVAFALMFCSTAGNIITVYVNHYPPTIASIVAPDPKEKNGKEYYRIMYSAMWIRCQIYIMGLIVGWLLQTRKKLKIPVFIQYIFWFLSVALMCTALFGLYGFNKGTTHLTLFERAMYSAFSKPAWGLGLSWILIACYYGYGGFVNRFMSWNIWVPLGRLSYAAYLIHMEIIDYVNSEEDHAILYSGIWNIFYERVFSVLCLTFFLSLIWSSLFEVPVAKIESILLRPQKRKIQLEEEKTERDGMTSYELDLPLRNGKVKELDQ